MAPLKIINKLMKSTRPASPGQSGIQIIINYKKFCPDETVIEKAPLLFFEVYLAKSV